MRLKEIYLEPMGDPLVDRKLYKYKDIIAEVSLKIFKGDAMYRMVVRSDELKKVMYFVKPTPYELKDIKANIKLARKKFK